MASMGRYCRAKRCFLARSEVVNMRLTLHMMYHSWNNTKSTLSCHGNTNHYLVLPKKLSSFLYRIFCFEINSSKHAERGDGLNGSLSQMFWYRPSTSCVLHPTSLLPSLEAADLEFRWSMVFPPMKNSCACCQLYFIHQQAFLSFLFSRILIDIIFHPWAPCIISLFMFYHSFIFV